MYISTNVILKIIFEILVYTRTPFLQKIYTFLFDNTAGNLNSNDKFTLFRYVYNFHQQKLTRSYCSKQRLRQLSSILCLNFT